MPGYDAGSIESRLEVDLYPFKRGLQEAKKDAREFQRQRYSATLDVDDTRGRAKVIDIKTRLESVARTQATARVAVENGQAIRRLIDTSDRLDRIRRDVATARVNADTDQARARLDALDIQLRRIGLITSRPKVTVEGVERANLQLDALELRLAATGRGGGPGRGGPGGFGGFARFIGGLPNPSWRAFGVTAALPLLPGAAGLAAGGAASFLTPTVAGLLGLGTFGAAAKSSITTVDKNVTKLTALTQRYNAAVTDKQRSAVLAQEKRLWDSMDPAQRKAVANVRDLDTMWARFQHRLQPQSFGVLASGAQLGRTGLGLVFPSAAAAGTSLIGLERSTNTKLQSQFSKVLFRDVLPGETQRAIQTGGTALQNTFAGLGHLLVAFLPLGHDLEDWLDRTSARFERWTEGTGPAKFVRWVEHEAPVAARDLKSLGFGLEGLFNGLSPLARIEMSALTPVLNFVGELGKEHPEALTAIAGGYLAIAGGLKAISAVGSLGKLTGASGGSANGGKFMAGVAGFTGAVVAGEAGKHSGTSGALLGALGGAASGALAGAAIGGAPGAAIGALGGAAVSLATHFLNLGGSVDDVSARLAVMSGNIADVLKQDKGKFGGNSRAYLEQYLQDHPDLLASLAKQGIGENTLAAWLKAGGGYSFTTPQGRRLADVLAGPGGNALFDLSAAYNTAVGTYNNLQQVRNPNTRFPGMPAGWHPPMAPPGSYPATTFNAMPKVPATTTQSIHDYDTALQHLSQTLKGLPGFLRAAAVEMKAGGFALGKDLKTGIILGFQQTHGVIDLVNIKSNGHGGVNVTNVKAQLAAGGPADAGNTYLVGERGPELFTPRTSGYVHPNSASSSIGTVIGRQMAQAFGAQAPSIARIFGTGTAAALKSALGTAGSRLASAQQQYAADRASQAQFTAGLSSQFVSGLNLAGAIGPNGNVGNLTAYIGNYAKQLRTLSGDEKRLRAKHLSPGLLDMITQVAAANGPAAGIALATSILSGRSGSTGTLNRELVSVNRYAGAAAGQDAAAMYGRTLAKDQQMIDLLKQLIEVMKTSNPKAVAAALDGAIRTGKAHR